MCKYTAIYIEIVAPTPAIPPSPNSSVRRLGRPALVCIIFPFCTLCKSDDIYFFFDYPTSSLPPPHRCQLVGDFLNSPVYFIVWSRDIFRKGG